MSEKIISNKYIVIKVTPIRSQRKEPWHLFVHEQESIDQSKSDLTLAYWLVSARIGHGRCSGEFKASYGVQDGRLLASLVSHGLADNGALFLDLNGLEGNHSGTYLMDRIVQWLQNNCPGAEVIPVRLEIGQAKEEEMKIRRNKFWENFGLIFEWQNSETLEVGKSKPMTVAQLKPRHNWTQNIEEFNFADYITDINQKIRDLSDDLSMMTSRNEKLENELRFARRYPVRFFMKTIMKKNIR